MNEPPVDGIIRKGGRFWVIYVTGQYAPDEWRPVTREILEDAARSELVWYRDHDTLGRTYKAQRVVVTVEELDW